MHAARPAKFWEPRYTIRNVTQPEIKAQEDSFWQKSGLLSD